MRVASERTKRRVDRISDDVFDLLYSYPWHGNIRELQNAVERALLLSDGIKLHVEDFPRQLEWSRHHHQDIEEVPANEAESIVIREVRQLKDVEKETIANALRVNNGNIALTARQLGIGRNTLYRKIEEHGLQSLKQSE